jgi:hypothetical protein
MSNEIVPDIVTSAARTRLKYETTRTPGAVTGPAIVPANLDVIEDVPGDVIAVPT